MTHRAVDQLLFLAVFLPLLFWLYRRFGGEWEWLSARRNIDVMIRIFPAAVIAVVVGELFIYLVRLVFP